MSRRQGHLLLLFLFAFTFSANAQTFIWQPGETIFGFNGGANYSSLRIDGVQLSPAARPFAGYNATYVFTPQFGIKSNLLFSMKGSHIQSTANYQQFGIDFQVYPQYKWDDLYLNAGFSYERPFHYGISYIGNSASERTRVTRDYYQPIAPQLNLLLGFEFKLMDNWNLISNFSVPMSKGNSANYQFGLSYRLSRKKAPKESPRKIRKRITSTQIRELRNGVLLVRLKTSKPVIEARKAMGFPQKAKEIEEKQRIENMELMSAFRSTYNFSDYRFFMSDDSYKVRRGDYRGVFVDENLEVDSTIVIPKKSNVFMAEFAIIEPDTAKLFSHYEWQSTGHFAGVQVPVYYGGERNQFMALVIKDQNFQQLDRPFPYYSRALFKAMEDNPGHKLFYFPVMLFSPMTYTECVGNLNIKLHKFLEKVNTKWDF